MPAQKIFLRIQSLGFFALLSALLLTGCHSANNGSNPSSPSRASDTAAPAQSREVKSKAAPLVIRIRVGNPDSLTDSRGNIWLGDRGFADGETIARAADLSVDNTKDPDLYRFERYSMTAFSYPLPNGRYTVKLHFAETFEGISGPGQRVFSFDVQGHPFKDFDVWAKAGGPQRAYIESVNVNITEGKLDIKFTSQIENPEINGIEILPVL